MSKKYDLEERTFKFAKAVIKYINGLKKILSTELNYVAKKLKSPHSGLNFWKIKEKMKKNGKALFKNL